MGRSGVLPRMVGAQPRPNGRTAVARKTAGRGGDAPRPRSGSGRALRGPRRGSTRPSSGGPSGACGRSRGDERAPRPSINRATGRRRRSMRRAGACTSTGRRGYRPRRATSAAVVRASCPAGPASACRERSRIGAGATEGHAFRAVSCGYTSTGHGVSLGHRLASETDGLWLGQIAAPAGSVWVHLKRTTGIVDDCPTWPRRRSNELYLRKLKS